MIDNILVVGQLPPPVHGSNVMTERFMDALAANKLSPVIVGKRFSTRLDEVGKISLKKIFQIPSLFFRVRNAILSSKPKYCVYFISVGLSSLLVDCLILYEMRRMKIPYILYFHGMGYRNYESSKQKIIKKIVVSAVCKALGGIVLGELLKDDVNQLIPNNRLFVLPNGIPVVSTSRTVLNKKSIYVNIIFISNLIPAKGPHIFLNMAREIHRFHPYARFFLAGKHISQQYVTELNSFIETNGLKGIAIIVGPVYGTEKDNFFRDADIMVFPTSKDTFPIVNIEAMMWGIPVVTSFLGAIPEVIRDGVNGYIVDPANLPLIVERVLKLIRDPELRQQMGVAGRNLFYENYSLEAYRRNVKKAFQFFDKLLYEQR
jgi:glycosyltransferase involved in cell wall biosynthesis